MSLSPELKEQVLALSLDDQELLCQLIEENFERLGAGAPFSPEWINEMERRVEAYERGETTARPADEVIAELRAEFSGKRAS